MTLATAKGQKYLADFNALQDGATSDGAAWLTPLRRHAWSVFQELGFPTHRRGNELWKYTNLRPLDRATFAYPHEGAAGELTLAELKRHAPWSDEWTTLVFVDGHYSASLSRVPRDAAGVRAVSLAQAAGPQRAALEGALGTAAAVDGNPFVALNTAFLGDGAFVDVEPGREANAAVHLLFVTTAGGPPRVTYPRTLVRVGAAAGVTLIESYIGLGAKERFTDPVTEVLLEEGARVEHYRLVAENENTFHIGTTRVRLAADTTFTTVSFATGPAIGRNDLHAQLDGPGAECRLEGLYLTTNDQHLDNHISTTHATPHGTSHQFYKGILSGNSRAVFSGRVLVERDAQKTVADQKDLNLLLSKGAEIDTKPSLEIYADDVKCSHGATAGHTDPEALYYLQTRGINLKTARAMLIRGFAAEIVEKFKPAALREYVEKATDRAIPALEAAAHR
ncbi:MAG: Fe-S cluster assembly protein SufD [Dehalococcoidia bacterium]